MQRRDHRTRTMTVVAGAREKGENERDAKEDGWTGERSPVERLGTSIQKEAEAGVGSQAGWPYHALARGDQFS
jgi:hypothetical protein